MLCSKISNSEDIVTEQAELFSIYVSALRTRHLDVSLQKAFHEKRARVQFSGIGNEVSQCMVGSLLQEKDILIPHYRGYGTLLGKGVSLKQIIYEKLGLNGGFSSGIGDTAPYHEESVGIIGHSIKLGANIPIASGAALAQAYLKKEGIVAVVFGDGESLRGTFGATLGFVSSKKLPMLFVCLNNGYSMNTNTETFFQEGSTIARVKGYGIPAQKVKEYNVTEMFSVLSENIHIVRNINEGPRYVEIQQERFTSHSTDYDANTITGENIPPAKDPLMALQKLLLNSDHTVGELERINIETRETIRAELEEAFAGDKISLQNLSGGYV